jgi:hypothetical protein
LRARRRVLIGVAASALGHGMIVLALFTARAHRIETRAEPVTVTLVPRLLVPPKAPTEASAGGGGAPAPRPPIAKPPPDVPTLPTVASAAASDADVGEGELAGAAGAGSGGGGGGCDMVGRLQSALRRDAQVQAAVAKVDRGRALRVWNGAWVLHPGQEGSGLAAVREAIIWEVGFAPDACKRERVHGLVLITLGERPGAPRLVLGTQEWRWTDLLH